MERLTVDSNFPEKNNSQILIYQTEGGKTKIEVRLENETVWLTQKLLAELFQKEGKREVSRTVDFYNPDMIISVGYRIKSNVGTSIDYDPTIEISINFFKTVQNKLHWAITCKTAAEIIHERADSTKPNMGLTNWRGEKLRKQDVKIA
jgi:hypothetical protein